MNKIEKIKFIFYGLLFGLILFPIITLGDSFASFLMQGKSSKEAIQILIEQADHSKKMDFLNQKLNDLELSLEIEKACRKKNDLIGEALHVYWQGYRRVIISNDISELINVTKEMIENEEGEKEEFLISKLEKLEEIYEEYLLMEEKCGE